MKKILLILSILCFFTIEIYSQEKATFPEQKQSMNAIGFTPQYALINGLKFEYDRRISQKSNHWIIISPHVYIAQNSSISYSFKSLFGFGLDVKHKVFLQKSSNLPKGLYFQYGPAVQRFTIDDDEIISEKYIQNGIEYYKPIRKSVRNNLTKISGNINVGYQFLMQNRFYIDFYLGSGIRVSFDDKNNGYTPLYNDSWLGYGYSGILLDGGMRLGFLL